MKHFVISDTHFGHRDIMGYCNRPFADTKEMDELMIERWNEVVGKDDVVIHLGDFGLASKEYLTEVVSRLNGHKILVLGNHDEESEQYYRDLGFETVSRYPILYGGTPDNCGYYLMSHAPLLLSETTPYFNFYGHVHNDSKYVDSSSSKCVCVEKTDYRPYLFWESK